MQGRAVSRALANGQEGRLSGGTQVRNFPSSRGTVVGVMKAGIGLSGALPPRPCHRPRPAHPRTLNAPPPRMRILGPAACTCSARHVHPALPGHGDNSGLACWLPSPSGSLFASVYSGVFAPARTPFLVFLALAPAAVGLLALPLINTCSFVQARGRVRGWPACPASAPCQRTKHCPQRRPLLPASQPAGWYGEGARKLCPGVVATQPKLVHLSAYWDVQPVLGAYRRPVCPAAAPPQVCELETGQHVFTTEGRFIFALQTLGTLAVFLITGERGGRRVLRCCSRCWLEGGESACPLCQAARRPPVAGQRAPGVLFFWTGMARCGRPAIPAVPLSHLRLSSAALASCPCRAGATVEALLPMPARARLLLTAGAGLLLLPLLVIPHGSGGLLSQKAQLHQALSMYQQEEGEEGQAGADPEAGAASSGSAAAAAVHAGTTARAVDDSLKRPLLEPGGMQRCGAEGAAGGAGAGADQPAVAAPSSGTASTASTATLPELSPAQCLRSANFWLLFASLTISMGSGEVPGLGASRGAGAAAGPALWLAHAMPTPACETPQGTSLRSQTAHAACTGLSVGVTRWHTRPLPPQPPHPTPPPGLTLLNNLAQVVKALAGEPQEDTPVLVSLFSVANCAGRAGARAGAGHGQAWGLPPLSTARGALRGLPPGCPGRKARRGCPPASLG